MRIQHDTATDFQGSSKMTLKIKMTDFSIFRSGFSKTLSQPYIEQHRQAKNDKVEQM